MTILSFVVRFDTRAIQIITQNNQGNHLDTTSYTPSGWEMIEAVVEHLKAQHDMLISRVTAERVIIKLASATENTAIMKMEVRGRLISQGIPGIIEVTSTHLSELLLPHFTVALFRVIWGIKANLTFYSDRSDIEFDKQIILTGDFCEIHRFDELLEKGLQETCGAEFTVFIQGKSSF